MHKLFALILLASSFSSWGGIIYDCHSTDPESSFSGVQLSEEGERKTILLKSSDQNRSIAIEDEHVTPEMGIYVSYTKGLTFITENGQGFLYQGNSHWIFECSGSEF